MQVEVSEEFREQCYSGESLYNARLTINGNEVPMSQISKIKINSPIVDTSKDTFYVGTFISQEITIIFKNLDNLDIQTGNEVYLEIGQLINEQYEYVPIGHFLIDDLSENYYSTCEIPCLDYATKFKTNVDYSPCFEDGVATIDTILEWICAYFGVDIGSYPSTNGDVEIGTYNGTVSGKQWISYIAELKGCNAKMGRDGRLYLIPIKRQPTTTIDALKSKSWSLGEKFKISQVTYFDALRNFTFGEETDNTLFIRQDNPFVISEEVVENIYDEVNGFEIYSLKVENYGDISLNCWDIVTYTLGEDENEEPITYNTFYNNNMVYEMNIMVTNETKVTTKQQEITTNIIEGDDKARIRRLSTTVDGIENQIRLLVEESDGVETVLSQTVQTVNNIQNIFQITGGNNLIKNSQFLFPDAVWEFTYDDTDDLAYHTSLGNGYNSELIGLTTSVANIVLRNMQINTTNDNITGLVIGQTYNLSYLYSNSANTTSRVTLTTRVSGETIYDVTYDTEASFEEATFSFAATDSSYILTITTTTTTGETNSGYFTIYDLMLNSGEKKSWESAESEIYSTILKMSNYGLQVYASGSGIITLLTAQGFQVRKSTNGEATGDIITEYSDKGLRTGIAETKEVHTGNFIMVDVEIGGTEHHIEYFDD